MKQGTFTQIPHGPVDLEGLWFDASVLGDQDLPDWLDMQDRDFYRLVGTISCPSFDTSARAAYLSEIEELELGGLLADQDPRDPWSHRVYVPPPYDEVWSISIYEGPSPLDLTPWDEATGPAITRAMVTDVTALFVADPFMLLHEGIWYLFFEVLNWHAGKGEIALATSTDAKTWHYQGVVLAEEFHLSYPFVFTHNGKIYMTPETHQAGAVRLYEAVAFPRRWRLVTTLLEADCLVDPTLIHHADRWWLFVETSPTASHDTLRLYSSASLAGPWDEHPSSPLTNGDPAASRPGGRVISRDGAIIRFAQDCSSSYGEAVRAFQVTCLTTEAYEELELGAVLRPSGSGWNSHGMHHVDATLLPNGRWLACVDGRTSVAAGPGARTCAEDGRLQGVPC